MNFAEDAVYPLSQKDADGDEYDGAKHRYVMRFEKGQMPPVKGFWSLTMYDPISSSSRTRSTATA